MSGLSDQDPLLGRQLANYRLERVIGRGGMATVYFGTDVKLNRPVAVKVIDARYRDNPAYAGRFVREAQLVATWRHQNILQVYYADDQDDLYFFAMEYVDGLDVRQLIDMYAEDGQLMPVEDVLRIGHAVAAALDYAHEQGVIHRDIKPSNVMVAYTGRVLLTDFGLALQVTRGSMGEVFGTPYYMAPEQARRSADAVPQSDLYSLGVIFFEMLTGQVPFIDDSPASVALMHLTEPPPSPRSLNPQLSAAAEAVLLQALAKEPAERFQSGSELLAALHEALLEDVVDPQSLPPLPALVQQETGRDQTGEPQKSYLTVAERLALSSGGGQGTAQTLPEPASDEGEPSPRRRAAARFTFHSRWLWVGLVLAAAVLFSLAVWWQGGEVAGDERGPTMAAATTAAAISPTLRPTRTLPPPARVTLAAAGGSGVTREPATAAATVPPAATPTLTPSPSPTPFAPVLVSDPDLMLLYGSPLAFYVRNETERTVDIGQLSFIAVDNNDELTEYAFRASLWGTTRLQTGNCNALEVIIRRESLRPRQCRAFNWVDHPGLDSTQVFWQSRPEEEIARFRVLWAGQPIQTCAILSGSCAVKLP